jgi:LysR family transcriptional activator of nhaA
VAQDRAAAKTLPLRIGIADSVPKSVAYRVVEPALRVGEALRLVCREGRLAALLGDLAVHRLDMVIADRPMPANINVRAYNHALGSSDVTVFGAPELLRTLSGRFPQIIDQAPFLLPGEDVAVRPRLTQWFESQGLYPRIVGEFDDSALLKSFGQAGSGLFVAPTAIADYVCRQYSVAQVGRIEPVIEELYAITTERRLTHPGVIAVVKATQREVFGVQTGATNMNAARARETAGAARQRKAAREG